MKPRVLSGMRPSGKLHLGHYWGALRNWVDLQEKYDCFYMVADWHALTSEYTQTRFVEDNIYEMVVDWLTCGINPDKSIILRQSWVKEHAELNLILSMITPLSWLERCPTYKEQMLEIKDRDLSTYGFLGYPVLQAADILIYLTSAVPVGEDQLPHLELCREIVRRFNNFYGNVLFEPQAILSPSPRVPGIDNRKMSKSYNNAILLSDNESITRDKVKQMYTDPQKIRVTDPGHPEGCVVCAFQKLYNPDWKTRQIQCTRGEIGCVACKTELTELLNQALKPLRTLRQEIGKDKERIYQILKSGSQQAGLVARQTMKMVNDSIHFNPLI